MGTRSKHSKRWAEIVYPMHKEFAIRAREAEKDLEPFPKRMAKSILVPKGSRKHRYSRSKDL